MSGASVTVFTKLAARGEPTTLSKRISIGTDGRVFSDGSGCRMAEGIAQTVSAPDAQTLARVIGNLGSENALALGASEHSECRVVTARALKQMNGRALNGMPVIARTREFLDYRHGPAWMLLDFDAKHMPDHLRQTIADKGGMWAVLNLLVPGLATCAHARRASTSAGLRHIDNGPIEGRRRARLPARRGRCRHRSRHAGFARYLLVHRLWLVCDRLRWPASRTLAY